ncbi:hypothetical protein K0U00_05080, partial [Paenibacillus sepulcri]|nr:hypothetical protein [Paenibacillus sepulcri]
GRETEGGSFERPQEHTGAKREAPECNSGKLHNPEQECISITSEAQWIVEPLGPNMIRLDRFSLHLPGEEEGILVGVKTFIDQCEDLAAVQALPVAFRQSFGTPMKVGMDYPLEVTYRTRLLVTDLPAECSLVMDELAISGEWVLMVNGTSFRRDQFRATELYDYRNISSDIASMLRVGDNEISVSVRISSDEDGLLDAIYLAGSFGVELQPTLGSALPVISAVPRTAASLPHHYTEGFPYYAGALRFTRQLDMSLPARTDEIDIQFADWETTLSVQIRLNGHDLGVQSWSPYRWRASSAQLRSEGNTIEVDITNTLVGLLEGAYFDYREHKLQPLVP